MSRVFEIWKGGTLDGLWGLTEAGFGKTIAAAHIVHRFEGTYAEAYTEFHKWTGRTMPISREADIPGVRIQSRHGAALAAGY